MPQNQKQLPDQMLSKAISDEFARFFLDVLRQANQSRREDQACPAYIVVVSNRGLAMFFAYLNILRQCAHDPDTNRPAPWKSCTPKELQNLAEIFHDCVITGAAAWAMAYDVAQHYLETGIFPRLIVVDELPLHGRALNGFLYGLEKRLLHAEALYAEKVGTVAQSRAPIQNAFLGKLHIRVIHRLAGSSVLLPRYQKILNRDNPSSTELPLQAWRNYSIAYTQYASIYGAHLTGRFICFPAPEAQDHAAEAPGSSTFTRVCTQLQNIKQETWLYSYPSAAQPQIISAVRCQHGHREDGQTLYVVPHMILDHISWGSLLKLHNRLVQEAQAGGKHELAALLGRLDPVLADETNSDAPLLATWLSQTTDLVLSTWLLKQFLQEVKGISPEQIAAAYGDRIDLEPLVCNFRAFGPADQAKADILSALQELWDWEPAGTLGEYLAAYAANGQPISASWMDVPPPVGDAELTENSPMVQCLEDSLAKISLEAERNAYTLYGSGLFFSDAAMSNWGDAHSISTLLEKLYAQEDAYPAVRGHLNLYETAAILIQAMDLGLLNMDAVFGRQPCTDRMRYEDGPRELYTWLRAGEAALFLLPLRYRNLLTVLDEVQEKRREDLDGAAFDLIRFVDSLASRDPTAPIQIAHDLSMPAEQLRRSLCSAYELFVLGGQKFKEWECYLHDRRLPAKMQNEVGEADRGLRMYFLSAYRNP
ncbi:hypothetical protein [Flavonifractor sp. An306]|uniref:hypothetical protein n=1 Tax=Flavonifractor sp. An306 TaxID=1965629 RepID=UPI000B392752|nr:hypothetical protein [Flavonifractor sp. An306]OUO43787.1 hypothetical protein B5F88_02290 [Flavonifractor sp. An306]